MKTKLLKKCRKWITLEYLPTYHEYEITDYRHIDLTSYCFDIEHKNSAFDKRRNLILDMARSEVKTKRRIKL